MGQLGATLLERPWAQHPGLHVLTLRTIRQTGPTQATLPTGQFSSRVVGPGIPQRRHFIDLALNRFARRLFTEHFMTVHRLGRTLNLVVRLLTHRTVWLTLLSGVLLEVLA